MKTTTTMTNTTMTTTLHLSNDGILRLHHDNDADPVLMYGHGDMAERLPQYAGRRWLLVKREAVGLTDRGTRVLAILEAEYRRQMEAAKTVGRSNLYL